MPLKVIISITLLFCLTSCFEYSHDFKKKSYDYEIRILNSSSEDVYLFLNNWILLDTTSVKAKYNDKYYVKNFFYNPSVKVNKIMGLDQQMLDTLPKVISNNFITSFIGNEPPLFLFLKSKEEYRIRIDSLNHRISNNTRVQLLCFTKSQLESIAPNYILYFTKRLVITINNNTSIGVVNIKQNEIKFNNIELFDTLDPVVLYGKLNNIKIKKK
ncbi:MAG: hypothetical protein WC121_02115 [Candidatus Kapaibacterium sp.]